MKKGKPEGNVAEWRGCYKRERTGGREAINEGYETRERRKVKVDEEVKGESSRGSVEYELFSEG